MKIRRKSITPSSLLFLVSLLSLLTFSQAIASSFKPIVTIIPMSFNGIIVVTTPQSISNHVYCLGEIIKGQSVISTNLTSISGYISALGLPPLPLDGVALTPPQAIGDSIYFAYVPGVSLISNLNNITKAFLACANYTDGSWHVKDVMTSGVVTGIFAYNNSIYALWKSSPNSQTYLLLISQNQVVRNVSINVVNASTIEVSNNNVGVVSNVSSLLSNLRFLLGLNIKAEYYVINLSTGKVIYEIPNYNNASPALVSVSNGLGLVSYISNTSSSFLVLYNLSTGKILSEKSFTETALGYINEDFILVIEKQKFGNDTLSIYNLSWVLLYREGNTVSLAPLYQLNGLYVNSSNVIILLTQVSSHSVAPTNNTQTLSVIYSSSLELINAIEAPKPFTIYVYEHYHPGYTTLNISWNENQPDKYLVYLNNTLIADTMGNFTLYNVTENTSCLIKVVVENPLGELKESATTHVTVYPVMTTNNITSTKTSEVTTSNTSINEFTLLIIGIVVIVIVGALILFAVKRK